MSWAQRVDSVADSLIKDGRFVVVEEFPMYCQITDALIGSGKRILSHHATREEAMQALPIDEEDAYHYIFPPEERLLPIKTAAHSEEDDFPF